MNKNESVQGFSRRDLLKGLVALGMLPGSAMESFGAKSASQLNIDEFLLCIVGIYQPISLKRSTEIIQALLASKSSSNCLDAADSSFIKRIPGFFASSSNSGRPYLIEVGEVEKEKLYSLTRNGNQQLSSAVRGIRDQVRLFSLLGPRQARENNLKISDKRGGCDSMGGASPSNLARLLYDDSHPGRGQDSGKRYLGRDQHDFVENSSSALHLPRFYFSSFLSFATRNQLENAGVANFGGRSNSIEFIKGESFITGEGLALCLGISYQMLFWLEKNTRLTRKVSPLAIQQNKQAQNLLESEEILEDSNNLDEYSSRLYNRFYLEQKKENDKLIRKKDKSPSLAKRRLIESPRIFLKVVQRFILDFIILPGVAPKTDSKASSTHTEMIPVKNQVTVAIHPAVHSYQAGRGIVSNAHEHLGQRQIAKMDIVDYFGHIRRPRINRVFSKLGMGKEASSLLAGLCTVLDPTRKDTQGNSISRLPQGAPTSPALSNLALYDFDKKLTEICEKRGLSVKYSRYADDLTLSGKRRDQVRSAFLIARQLLLKTYNLQVNAKKTAFISHGRQQRVTGIVVNEKGLPPRQYRRRVRAAFHQAGLNPGQFISRLSQLQGHYSYLSSFSDYPLKELEKYSNVLARLRSFQKTPSGYSK